MGLVNKSDYIYAKLQDKALQISDELIELDDKEIIRLGLKSQDVLTVNIDHIEWSNTESLETYEGTKASLPKINICWDDETVTEASINYTMIDNVSYYLEPGNYELRAIYRDFTSTNVLPITVIEKVLVSIEWENTNPITTQQNHKAYLPYIKLNYNDGKFKRLSSQSPGVTLNDSEYYLELGEKTLTATYKEFTTNELIINVIEEEIIIPQTPDDPNDNHDENTHDYSKDYLTFEALEDGIFTFYTDKFEFKLNNDDWYIDNNITKIYVKNGDRVQIKNFDYSNWGASSLSVSKICTSTCKYNVCGNINLSINYCNNRYTLDECFYKEEKLINANNLILDNNVKHYESMFEGCTSLITAPELPAATLTNKCYSKMFKSCTSLTTVPSILPATILAYCCYESMFEGCTSLITAPELPATTLADYCYYNMFRGCASLVTAPVLPATTLAQCCYESMFEECTSLITAPELPATTLAQRCYELMFYGCTSLTTAPELSATTLKSHCYSCMFCRTSLVYAPELPATTLASYCYNSMFSSCTSLVYATELPAETLASYCYQYMFSNCTSLTAAPELPATTLADTCYFNMFWGCTSLTTAPELPATILTNNCYANMFQGCTSLTTPPELPATILVSGCYNSMFDGCTSLVYAPELPAITLAGSCYNSMFSGCTSITIAPELPASSLTESCYSRMFSDCTSLVTAPELLISSIANSCCESMFNNCKQLNFIKLIANNDLIDTLYLNTSLSFGNWLSGVAETGTLIKSKNFTKLSKENKLIPTGWTVQEIDPETGEIVNEYITE